MSLRRPVAEHQGGNVVLEQVEPVPGFEVEVFEQAQQVGFGDDGASCPDGLCRGPMWDPGRPRSADIRSWVRVSSPVSRTLFGVMFRFVRRIMVGRSPSAVRRACASANLARRLLPPGVWVSVR